MIILANCPIDTELLVLIQARTALTKVDAVDGKSVKLDELGPMGFVLLCPITTPKS